MRHMRATSFLVTTFLTGLASGAVMAQTSPPSPPSPPQIQLTRRHPLTMQVLSVVPAPAAVVTARPDLRCNGVGSLSGKSFDRIELVLEHRVGTVYPNDFFQGNTASSHFSVFGAVPAGTKPAIPLQHSGAISAPTSSGFGSALTPGFSRTELQLQSVECTAKFGGSFQFHFVQKEDVQYEVFDANYLWDLQGLEINVFVTPTPWTLMAQGRAMAALRSVEFGYSQATAYSNLVQPTSGVTPAGAQLVTNVTREQSAQSQALDAVLRSVQINDGPLRFMALGLVHALAAPQFSGTNVVVDAVQISDGTLTLLTHTGVRIAEVYMRIDGIDVDTEPGGEEFILTAYEGLGYGFEWRAIARDLELGQNEPSRYFRLGAFLVTSNCSPVTYSLHYDLAERDDAPIVGSSTIFTSTEYFEVREHSIQVDCTPLLTAASGQVVDQGTVGGIEVHDYNRIYAPRGSMNVGYRVAVALR